MEEKTDYLRVFNLIYIIIFLIIVPVFLPDVAYAYSWGILSLFFCYFTVSVSLFVTVQYFFDPLVKMNENAFVGNMGAYTIIIFIVQALIVWFSFSARYENIDVPVTSIKNNGVEMEVRDSNTNEIIQKTIILKEEDLARFALEQEKR